MSVPDNGEASAGVHLDDCDDLLDQANDSRGWWWEVARNLFEEVDTELDTFNNIRSRRRGHLEGDLWEIGGGSERMRVGRAECVHQVVISGIRTRFF